MPDHNSLCPSHRYLLFNQQKVRLTVAGTWRRRSIQKLFIRVSPFLKNEFFQRAFTSCFQGNRNSYSGQLLDGSSEGGHATAFTHSSHNVITLQERESSRASVETRVRRIWWFCFSHCGDDHLWDELECWLRAEPQRWTSLILMNGSSLPKNGGCCGSRLSL